MADTMSLESLIQQGLVTHLCSGQAALLPEETVVLAALCEAIAGQIYRIDALTYVFRLEAGDLDGALAEVPFDGWADLLAGRLREALDLGSAPHGITVRTLGAVGAEEPADVDGPMEAEAAPEAEVRDEEAADGADVTDAEPAVGLEDGAAETADVAQAGLVARLDALAAAMARMEAAMSADGLGARIGLLEIAVADLAAQAEVRGAAAVETGRLVDEVAGMMRRLPEEVARHLEAPSAALEAMAQSMADLARGAQDPDAVGQRLEALGEMLEALPERAAQATVAQAGSFAPVHVALSGALARLEVQVEALMKRDAAAVSEQALRTEMAEFLARMERRLADAGQGG